MKNFFIEPENIHNRFFFIFGNTHDYFCGNNLIDMNLKYSLKNYLLKCKYEHIVFYSKDEIIHFYDDKSHNRSDKGHSEVEAFKAIDEDMKNKNVKTAVVITNADDFITSFSDDKVKMQVLNSFNEYYGLRHENLNIMLLIFPPSIIASEHYENEAYLWKKFFKERLKEEKITEIQISPPLAGEIRNTINYFRLMHGLKLDFLNLDNICKNIAKNFFAEKPALDSLNLLMMNLKRLADEKQVLNQKTVDELLGERENSLSKVQTKLATMLTFRGMLVNLSEEEIRQAEDIAMDKKDAVPIDDILRELDNMVGMKEVKKTMRDIAARLEYYKLTMGKNSKTSDGEGNHICIKGNPGTGKNTIVRTLAKLFKAFGLLADDNPIMIPGENFKSKEKAKEYCDQAMGRVLFIDEAYSLVNEKGPIDQSANEAIIVLMTRLENDRDKFICVVAGYPDGMDKFIEKSNLGMKSRFKHIINIPDYSAEELIEIFERNFVKENHYTLTDAACKKAREAIRKMVAYKAPNFGNVRNLRIFFGQVIGNIANRVTKLPDNQKIAVLKLIEEEDIP